MSHDDPKIGKTLLDDLHRGSFKKDVYGDYSDIKEYFLNEEKLSRLKNMGPFRRWVHSTIWLFKELILKLAPTRRILVALGIVIILISRNNPNLGIVGGIILLLVLLFELKDKLLAKDELAVGRSVQYALMPEKSPKIPGWSIWLYSKPANDVGGDLIDLLYLDEKRIGIALGDVAGKGLGAALLMAKLQSTIRALASEYSSLSRFGKKINEIFYRDRISKSFSSLVYLEFKVNADRIKLINAGHLPPIIIRNTILEELPKGEPALGILPDTKYKEHQFELKKNDILFIYSDGLTEARNEVSVFYNTDRLFNKLSDLSKLSTQEFAKQLLEEIDRFVGEAKVYDDMSFIILKKSE